MLVEQLTEDQVVQDKTYPIEVKVYEGGVQKVPSSATITVKDAAGTALVTAQAVSVAISGTMTYTLPAANTADLIEDGIIELTYIISAITYLAVFLYDVVLNKLKPTIIDQDLKNYAPQLADEIWSEQTNFDTQIQEAFRVIKRNIKDKGRRPHMLIDGSQLREVHIIKTMELIYFDFSKAVNDIFWEKYLVMKERYGELFDKLAIKYDSDEDGLIEEDERKEVLGQITLQR